MAPLPPASHVWGWTDQETELPAPEPPTSRIYGLCFQRDGRKAQFHHAGHYVGIALDGDVDRRVWEHVTGRGSPLVAAAVAAGLEPALVLNIPGDRKLERKLHNQHATSHSNGAGSRKRGWCPNCNPTPTKKEEQPWLTHLAQLVQSCSAATAAA